MDNFSTNRIEFKKSVLYSEPPPTPFRQSPPKAAGKLKSYFLEREGKTNKCSTKKTAGKASEKDGNTTKHGNAFKKLAEIQNILSIYIVDVCVALPLK